MISKQNYPENPSQFRPINLCNVLYKIMAKVLVNRLKQVLPKLISHHQAAFLLGRVISKNILNSHELLHHMKTHNSKAQLMAIKMDLSEA